MAEIRKFIEYLRVILGQLLFPFRMLDQCINDLEMSFPQGIEAFLDLEVLAPDRKLGGLQQRVRHSAHRRSDENRILRHMRTHNRSDFPKPLDVADRSSAKFHRDHNLPIIC